MGGVEGGLGTELLNRITQPNYSCRGGASPLGHTHYTRDDAAGIVVCYLWGLWMGVGGFMIEPCLWLGEIVD